jgi:hypothetical protein
MPGDPSECDLEQDAFIAFNDETLPRTARDLIGILWNEVCAREEWLKDRWQTIDTAPKSDLTEILLFEDGHIASGRFLAHAYRPGWYMSGNNPDDDYPRPDSPTHWMFLPPPPQRQDEEARSADEVSPKVKTPA